MLWTDQYSEQSCGEMWSKGIEYHSKANTTKADAARHRLIAFTLCDLALIYLTGLDNYARSIFNLGQPLLLQTL